MGRLKTVAAKRFAKQRGMEFIKKGVAASHFNLVLHP